MNRVILKKGRERSLLRKHPWVFSGAIRQIEGMPQPGETVDIFSDDNQFLARGAYSPASQIRVRIWTFAKAETVDELFFRQKILDSIALREQLQIPKQTNAYRLISSESDGLPGLIVDRYGDFLVCQYLSIGAEHWKDVIIEHLKAINEIEGIYERSDTDARKKEALHPSCGLLWGKDPPPLVEIEEQDLKFLVDIRNGHKTGFYLDQRVNRHIVQSYSAEAEVLNCFAYTGGFGLAALKGGASHVTNVENTAGLVELIDRNLQMNQFENHRCSNMKANVFQLLRQYVNEGKSFDLIILDPPKFADSQSQIPRASRGYKDINRLAFKLLRPKGLLFTFSCSGLVKMELFHKIIADAAIEAERDVQILKWLGQSPDHPVKIHIPESLYLKGLLLKCKC